MVRVDPADADFEHLYVERYGVYDFVGWYAGFVIFREVGPILVGLMFSGRVGASNWLAFAAVRYTDLSDASPSGGQSSNPFGSGRAT